MNQVDLHTFFRYTYCSFTHSGNDWDAAIVTCVQMEVRECLVVCFSCQIVRGMWYTWTCSWTGDSVLRDVSISWARQPGDGQSCAILGCDCNVLCSDNYSNGGSEKELNGFQSLKFQLTECLMNELYLNSSSVIYCSFSIDLSSL